MDAGTSDRLTPEELAARTGSSVGRILGLTRRGVLPATGDGRYEPGDIHRVRAIDAFEAAGVPLDALVAAQATGRVDFAYYDELHQPPGAPSSRAYDEFRASLGPLADGLPALWTAFGLAEPSPDSHLAMDEEAFIADLIEMVDATRQPELAVRVVRFFAEAARKASEAALGVYGDVVTALGDELAGLPREEEYRRVFVPWSRIARNAPALASWLTARHLSHAVDAYSVDATERILLEHGYVAERSEAAPGVAFVDLTDFTRLSEERGDEVAAAVALRLGELAREAASRHGGRVVKLLGDGVLLRLPDAVRAVDATLDLLDSLRAARLPMGHAGIHAGPLIEREGDVFGRSVNLAARVSDVAPPGEVYATQDVTEALSASAHVVEAVDAKSLQGIGQVSLFRVRRSTRA
jgi:class 3 adenylate cyclase